MFVIGTPVTVSSVTRRVADLPDAIIQRDTRRYFTKLINPWSWFRLLTFQTDYKTLFRRVSSRKCKRRYGRLTPGAAGPARSTTRRTCRCSRQWPRRRDEGNGCWSSSGKTTTSGRSSRNRSGRFGNRDQLPFTLVTIPDANHTLTEDPCRKRCSTR